MTDSGRIVVFADLDDTLFQTLRKLPEPDLQQLTPATLDTRGEPHSYCTPAQQTLLEVLAAGNATVVPVTGRDPAAMARVLLPFTSYRVLDHGLTIQTPGGGLEADWAARVRAELAAVQDELADLTAQAEQDAAPLGCRLTRHSAHGVTFMSVLKHPGADAAALSQMQAQWEAALPPGSPLHVIANANNVSLLPRALGKAEAVRYLREHHFQGAVLTLGLGDSVSDLPFLGECDFALTPSAGQLLRAATAAGLRQR